MQVGNVVRWTSIDNNGRFFHKGTVTELTQDRVTLETETGVMTIDLNDGEFKVVRKSADKPDVNVVATPRATRQRNVEKGSTTRDRAIALYNEMVVDGEHPSRKNVIAAFVEKLEMTPAGASTYHYNCKTNWCK